LPIALGWLVYKGTQQAYQYTSTTLSHAFFGRPAENTGTSSEAAKMEDDEDRDKPKAGYITLQ